MKPLHFVPLTALLLLAGAAAVQTADRRPSPSFVQVSIHGNEVAIASLPGDPLMTFDVKGDAVTFTHYCR